MSAEQRTPHSRSNQGLDLSHQPANPPERLRNVFCQAKSLLTNSTHIMATTVVTSLLGYAYWVLAARLYSPHDVGLAAALLSAMSLAALIVYMGVGSTLIQLLPRRKPGREQSLLITAAIATILVGAGIGGIILVAILPSVSAKFDLLRASMAVSATLAVGVVFTSLGTFVDDTTVARRSARGMFIRNTSFSVVKIGVLLLPFCVTLGTSGILFSWVVGATATALVGLLLLPRLVPGFKPCTRGAVSEMRRIVRRLAGNHMINLGGMLPILLLPVLVTVRLDPAQGAYFYTTWRVGGLFFMISPAVAAALMAEGAHRPADVAKTARLATGFIALLLVPVALVMILSGKLVLSGFGPNYAVEGYPLLVALAFSAFPDSVTNVYTSVLRVRGRLSIAAWLYLSMAANALVMTWLLLPVMGITAVGVSWLVTQGLGSIFVWWDSRRSSPHAASRGAPEERRT